MPRLVRGQPRNLSRAIGCSGKNHFVGCTRGPGDGDADERWIGVVARVEIDEEIIPGKEIEGIPGERQNGRVSVGALNLREIQEGHLTAVERGSAAAGE